jgi:hypothetical protein
MPNINIKNMLSSIIPAIIPIVSMIMIFIAVENNATNPYV